MAGKAHGSKRRGQEAEDEYLYPATRNKLHFHCLGAQGAAQISKGIHVQALLQASQPHEGASAQLPYLCVLAPHFTPHGLSRQCLRALTWKSPLVSSPGSWAEGREQSRDQGQAERGGSRAGQAESSHLLTLPGPPPPPHPHGRTVGLQPCMGTQSNPRALAG